MKFNLPINRVLLRTAAMWNPEAKWHDRDGLPIPATPKLVLGTRTILRRWEDTQAIDIVEHPLPDAAALNAKIPKPWPTGLAGQETPPWALHYVVYFCDPQTGSLYAFCNKTVGAKIAYEMLEEQIVVMRGLRGANLVPVVRAQAVNPHLLKVPDFWDVEREGRGPEYLIRNWRRRDVVCRRDVRHCERSLTSSPCKRCRNLLTVSGPRVTL